MTLIVPLDESEMKKMYFYRQGAKIIDEISLPADVKVKKCIPHSYVDGMRNMNIGRKRILYHYFYSLLFRGWHRTFVEYDLVKKGMIICKAVLISKVPIYKFLPRKGVHLGYCETIESERGNGFYPLLLRYIQHENPGLDLYMIVEESNEASIRGIEKAGFVRFAKGCKNDEGEFVISESL